MSPCNFHAPCVQAIVTEFVALDKQRISFLQVVLKGAAVARPQIDIGTAFSTAANMALGSTLSPAFSPYSDDLSFLEGAFLFSDLQVIQSLVIPSSMTQS